MAISVGDKAYLGMYREVKSAYKSGKAYCGVKVKREHLEIFKHDIRRIRHSLRYGAGGNDFIIYDKDGEGWTIIYGDTMKHSGTKAELLRYLWNECATDIPCSDYDCTGKSFTSNYKVAHLRGNEWKVAEHFCIDV